MLFSNPSVEIGIVIYVGIYLAGSRLTGRRFRASQLCALAGAAAALLFALDGPVDHLEDARLFTAHMVQHLILALVVPPLMLLATPDWLIRPLLRYSSIRTIARAWVNPYVAYLIYNLVLVGMHSPFVFDRMCRDEDFHIAMHLLLIATAVPLWWPLLSPLPELPRLSYPLQLLYLFFWLLPMSAIGAPLVLGETVFYPWYFEGPHPYGLTALQDQVLGGLTMWVVAGFYLIGIFTSIYFQWARYQGMTDEPLVNMISTLPKDSFLGHLE
jgi:putative membrane protein